MPTANEFAALFAGREGVYGVDNSEYHDGTTGPGPVYTEEEPPWLDHLDGDAGIGIYPVRADSLCTWGCIDIDYGYDESWPLAKNLANVGAAMSIPLHIERTRSKGYHLWCFVDGTVHHNQMRAALLVASSVAGVPAKEVNPKSFDLGADKLGNYVRLPYPHGYQDRQVMIDSDGYAYTLGEWIDVAWDNLVMPEAISAAADMWDPHQPERVPAHLGSSVDREVTDRLTPLAWTIYDGGPYDVGGDRSGALWKMVVTIIQDESHTIDEILALTVNADARWGKFHQRADGLDRLTDMVEKAWQLHAPEVT